MTTIANENELNRLLRKVQEDLEVYRLQVTDLTEQNIARIRLFDSMHQLHHHMEDVWQVYDADKLYPTELTEMIEIDEDDPSYDL